MKKKKRFKALRTSIVLYRIYAWLLFLLFIGIAMLFLYISTMNLHIPNIEYGGYIVHLNIFDNPLVTTLAAALSVLLGSKLFIRLYAKAEIMIAFLSIEENSRLAIELLTKIENQNDKQHFQNKEGNLR